MTNNFTSDLFLNILVNKQLKTIQFIYILVEKYAIHEIQTKHAKMAKIGCFYLFINFILVKISFKKLHFLFLAHLVCSTKE